MKFLKSVYAVALCLNIGMVTAVAEAKPQSPGRGVQKLTQAERKFKQQILNGYCCVPNLSSGYSTAKVA